MDQHAGVERVRERHQFHSARIDADALKEDPNVILAVARQLVAQQGEVGDLIVIAGPPHAPKLYEKINKALEREVLL